LHAGASWNRNAFEEILGHGLLDDHTLLRPSLKFFLFVNYGSQEEEKLRDLILDTLTVPYPGGSACVNQEDVARVESYLWTFLSSSQYPTDILLPFKKEEVLECLKNFRSLLAAAGWKSSSNQSRQENHANQPLKSKTHTDTLEATLPLKEAEEFLLIVNLLSNWCRMLALAWNSYEKVHRSGNVSQTVSPSRHDETISFESLITCLTPGTASDLANVILESISGCYHQIWTKKFELFHIRHGVHSLPHLASKKSHDEDQELSQSHRGPLRAGRLLKSIEKKRYIAVTEIELPVRNIFQQICKHMPTYSIDVLYKVFESNSAPVSAPVISVTTTPPQSSTSTWFWKRS
jgi:hypothetical protein